MSHSKKQRCAECNSNSFWNEFLALLAGMFAAGFFEEQQEFLHEEVTEEEYELWDIFL